MSRSRLTRSTAAVVVVAAALTAAACGDDDESGSTTVASSAAPATTAAPGTTAAPATTAGSGTTAAPAGVDLASVCPNPIVIQTNWYPQSTLAWFYGLIGPGGDVDTANARYSGPALVDPSVTVEIRGGGPLLGFQQGYSLLYADDDILITDQNLDAMISASKDFPTVGLLAPMELHPQILMWDPAKYQFDGIDDIKASGATVLVAGNAVYAEALIGIGALDEAQVDFSYDFSPSRFVAEGDLVQQGFATSEPYLYENVLEQWKKPVDYILVDEAGYPNYAAVVSTRRETATAEADCFAKLVPVLQQAVVDYMKDPAEINALLEELTVAWNSPSPLTPEQSAFATQSMIDNGIVANGDDATVGNFDTERVQKMIELTVPIFVGQGSETVDQAITVDQLVTNQFIDPTIGL